MNLNINELLEVAEKMEEMIGTEEFLYSLLKQMNDTELKEALEYIDRMHDTNLIG